MSKLITINEKKKDSYNIYIEDSYEGFEEKVKEQDFSFNRCMIVTDTNVEKHYLETIKEKLSLVYKEVYSYTFNAGEGSKNQETLDGIHEALVSNHFDRHDELYALGGGVVGDITGFAASIYMRGINYVQIPTSLLADVDSSIGGKCAIDFKQYKNMIGSFYNPRMVYMSMEALKTLPEREYYSGMAEVLKYGLIMDASFYEWTLEKMYEIHDRDKNVLEEMIEYSCKCKQRIVEKDPTEKGDRVLLNFGHTIGHAIEKFMDFKLLHGECVALGSVAAAYISWQKGKLSKDEYYEIRDMFVPFNLPISIENLDPDKILDLTKSDKKCEGDSIKFILLKKVGRAYVDSNVKDENILEGIREIHFTEDKWDS